MADYEDLDPDRYREELRKQGASKKDAEAAARELVERKKGNG